LRLLVAVTVEQHGVDARAGDLHQDDRGAARQADDLDPEAFDPSSARPVGNQRHRAIDVAVLRPRLVEHRRLGGDANVLGQGGQDVGVPGPLDEASGARRIDRHGPDYTTPREHARMPRSVYVPSAAHWEVRSPTALGMRADGLQAAIAWHRTH